MRSLLIRCYPASWRARYGDEFEAILEERPSGPFDIADILLGAVDARLRARGQATGITKGRGFTMSLRIGGIAAILGAASLAVAWLLSAGLVGASDASAGIAWILLVVGLALLLVAIAGLTAFQARTHPVMSWAACGLLTVGTIITFIGFFGAWLGRDGFWNVGALGVMTALVGSTLFAIVTYRTAALSRGAAVLLGVGSVVPFVVLVTDFTIVVAAALICFLVGWFLLGVQAIRLDRPSTEPRPA